MKKQEFLNKLYFEGKIQKIEPSDNLKNAYIRRAEESLSSAKVLLQIGNLHDATALAYYSMYYSALALLFKTGVKCENHTAAIIILEKSFNIDAQNISKAKSERIAKQYYAEAKVTKEETAAIIKTAEGFINKITGFIETLNNKKIREFQDNIFAMIGL